MFLGILMRNSINSMNFAFWNTLYMYISFAGFCVCSLKTFPLCFHGSSQTLAAESSHILHLIPPLFIYFSLYAWVCYLHACLYYAHACTNAGQRRTSDSLALELQVVMNHCVGAENESQVLCESSVTTEPSLQHLNLLFWLDQVTG